MIEDIRRVFSGHGLEVEVCEMGDCFEVEWNGLLAHLNKVVDEAGWDAAARVIKSRAQNPPS